jgi:MoaA/NifB/PqqE/SkfB family radical SAM enzyme
MDLAGTLKKSAAYGARHILQTVDYRFGRGYAAPDKVAFTLTHRCNCHCLMCDIWKMHDDEQELPAVRWIGILEELHAWIGTFRLALNGGEIFLKPGIYDIIRRAVEFGLSINPVSNGLIFKSDHHFRNLLNTGLPSITFSLDGRDAAIHDKHRGIPGIHATVTDVIRRIKRENPRMSVAVICIMMRETAPQLGEFARWAEDIGVDNVLFQPITQAPGSPEKRTDWHKDSDFFVRDLAALDRSIKDLIQLKTQTKRIELTAATLQSMQEYFAGPEQFQIKGRRCMLGQTDLRINPQGVVYLCDVRHTTIGHVDDGPMRDIWRGKHACTVRRLIKECRRPCATLCHRSPGLLEKMSIFLRYARAGRL